MKGNRPEVRNYPGIWCHLEIPICVPAESGTGHLPTTILEQLVTSCCATKRDIATSRVTSHMTGREALTYMRHPTASVISFLDHNDFIHTLYLHLRAYLFNMPEHLPTKYGNFRRIRKIAKCIYYLSYISVSVRINTSPPTGRIFSKFDIWIFF